MADLPALFATVGRGVLRFDASTRARLRITGKDARAFLHRMSTQHVGGLPPGESRLNVLTTDKGRIVDAILHLDRGDQGLLVVGSAGRGEALRAWLDRYLFTEDVELTDVSSDGAAVELYGAGALALASTVVAGAEALAPWGFVERGGCIAVRSFDRVDDRGVRVPSVIVVALDDAAALRPLDGATRVGPEEAETLRIAAGVPGAPELNDAFTPLDLGLHDAIHWAKGCYIGQEVIARLDTYGKQSKRLVGLVLDGPGASSGASVSIDGKVVGTVTSATSPLPFISALAIGRVPEGETSVHVQGTEKPIEARAVPSPTRQAPHD